ncbi:hypothetical protein SAMN02910368_01809 [Lachnospiraceae bacterium G11]|nr:hypothetical protein SAMN02910368_01809 [Lachnospiraceae bacterium G11]
MTAQESVNNTNTRDFYELKKANIITQKKGLPFMMASVIVWGAILAVQYFVQGLNEKNFSTFCCSCLLMPLAIMFSRMLGTKIVDKTGNPFSKLGFRLTLTQMLYLPIVMWAYAEAPEKMVMIYAIVFAAHLFPFAWLYDSRTYFTFAFVEVAAALVLGIMWGSVYVVGFMIIAQVIMTVLLFMEVRNEEKKND